MGLFDIFKKSHSNEYENLQSDILNCLGQSLKDEKFKAFIEKYNIKLEDKYNDKLFFCSNKFLQFQNRDQWRQTINEINITNNNQWLPYELKQDDTLKIIKSKLGEPDISDYRYNVLWYYDKLLLINFDNIQDENSKFQTVTFNDSLKVKPTSEKLNEIRTANSQYLKDIEDKSFGYNSKWVIIKSNNIDKINTYFEATELSNWRKAFEVSQSYRVKGVFVTIIEKYGVLIHGWALPEIDREIDFYKKLSLEFGETLYFANDLKSPFSWARFKNGEVIRAYSEAYFEATINIGQELLIEKENSIKRKALLSIEQEYDSDQDIKKEYRQFMSDLVLMIAKEWSFDPRNLSKIKLEEKVHLNKNYR